jgi:hypothetical protein
MLPALEVPSVVIFAVLGLLSGWLLIWVVTRRRPKHLPIFGSGTVFIAIAASIASQHPTWPDAQPASPALLAVAVGLGVTAFSAYWLLGHPPET